MTGPWARLHGVPDAPSLQGQSIPRLLLQMGLQSQLSALQDLCLLCKQGSQSELSQTRAIIVCQPASRPLSSRLGDLLSRLPGASTWGLCLHQSGKLGKLC